MKESASTSICQVVFGFRRAVPFLDASQAGSRERGGQPVFLQCDGRGIGAHHVTGHSCFMMQTLRHKGPRILYEKKHTGGGGLNAQHPGDTGAPRLQEGAGRHGPPGAAAARADGGSKGFWALDVSGNWRIVFRFEDQEPRDVDLVDYH